jgi:hypothetical protein
MASRPGCGWAAAMMRTGAPVRQSDDGAIRRVCIAPSCRAPRDQKSRPRSNRIVRGFEPSSSEISLKVQL